MLVGKSQSTTLAIHRFIVQNPTGNKLEELGTSPVPFQQEP